MLARASALAMLVVTFAAACPNAPSAPAAASSSARRATVAFADVDGAVTSDAVALDHDAALSVRASGHGSQRKASAASVRGHGAPGAGGDSGEIATQFEREALPKSPDDVVDYKARGVGYLAAKKGDEAVGALRVALSTDPSAWQPLGEAYLLSGDVDRGVACLEEAVAEDPQNTAARTILVKRYLNDDEGALARVYAEELVRQQPLDVSARQMLGRALMQQKMWKEAIAAFSLVVKSEPDNIYAHNNIGYSALQIGELELARTHLESCLSLEPQQGYMLNNLGVVYEKLDRHAEAHAAFSRAAELSPRYAQAQLNRDRLQGRLSHDERIVSAETLLKLREPIVADAHDNTDPSDVVGGQGDDDASPPDPVRSAVEAAVSAATGGGGGARLAPTGDAP